jgi:hypothetical protein
MHKIFENDKNIANLQMAGWAGPSSLHCKDCFKT